MNEATLETCGNCGDRIGKLETPMIWNENVVCVACHAKLATAPPPIAAPVEHVNGVAELAALEYEMRHSAPIIQTPAPAIQNHDAVDLIADEAFLTARNPIICPNVNCGFKGEGVKKPMGNGLIAVILLLFFIVPGIIYMIVYSGFTLSCPHCGVKVRDL
jgi:hypothetical protein